MESFFTQLELAQQSYSDYLQAQANASIFILIGTGFIGGLLSSLLPCVLSLLPINLAYIGTLKIDSRVEAFKKAGAFVLGVSLVMSLLGVFSGLAYAVFTEYNALINTVVGILIILMALALLEWIDLPLPQGFKEIPDSNPFIIGLVFALVSSPCSGPVLISAVTVAGSLGSVFKSLLLMFSYSLGYTAIIFFASLFTGLAKQLDWFKANSELIVKISGALLIIMGLVYLASGLLALF